MSIRKIRQSKLRTQTLLIYLQLHILYDHKLSHEESNADALCRQLYQYNQEIDKEPCLHNSICHRYN